MHKRVSWIGWAASLPALAALSALLAAPVAAQHARALPTYQVVFDDFDYAVAGYPDTTGGKALFGENTWRGRDGEAAYTGYAWYYYNWHWQDRRKTIHPSARFELGTEAPYSVRLIATEGYTRSFIPKDQVPIQLQSGFVYERGTWMLSARFDDLEAIPYFTQTFWLTSPMATRAPSGGVRTWSELNFEWQNWFAVLSQPGTHAWNTELHDDTWASQNKWVARTGYAGAVFPNGQTPSPEVRTYMANGVRMYELERGSTSTGETVGGTPLKNTRLSNPEDFTCYTSVGGQVTDISDPVTCMGFILKDTADRPNPWVHMMIQYDDHVVRFALVIPSGEADFVYMASSVVLDRRSLPLMVNLGMHTPNQVIALGPEEHATFEIDWFYYSPATDLNPWDVLDDVAAFRERAWGQVNLDAVPLAAPDAKPWHIRALRPPTPFDPGWIVDTTVRGTNGVEVQWNYRTRNSPDALFSDWSGWRTGGFRFEPDGPFYDLELDVRAKDHNAPEVGDRRVWANTACVRYTAHTRARAQCEGGAIKDNGRSLEQVPHSYFLDANYPNPFRDTTTIRFGLPIMSDVVLAVYDVSGRRVVTLLNQSLGSGYHALKWDASGLPSGTYIYRLETSRFTTSRPMVIVR